MVNIKTRSVESRRENDTNVDAQRNHSPGVSGIPKVNGDEDVRILGYLPDEQGQSVGNGNTKVRPREKTFRGFNSR